MARAQDDCCVSGDEESREGKEHSKALLNSLNCFIASVNLEMVFCKGVILESICMEVFGY